jgi:putative flippase GtrA
MIQAFKRFFRKEFWGLFKYGIVGVSCLLLHAGSYAWVTRILWPQGSRTLVYTVLLLLVACINFTWHRLWTFQVKEKSFAMVIRYSVIVGTSMGLQSGVFYLINDILHLHDSIAFVGAAGIAIVYQYFGHRFVTYNVRFEKKVSAVELEPPMV